MGLRERMPDAVTLCEFEDAGDERYRDALVLAKRGHRLAAIYLLGYVAEIELKCVFYRLFEYCPSDVIYLGPRGVDDPRGVAQTVLGVPQQPRGLHNPVLWARMIVSLRRQLEKPQDVDMMVGLLDKAVEIDENWKVSFRYNHDRTVPKDFRTMFDAVSWVRSHADLLWR